tara:strand:+ start:4546 stop:4881 length:336 start_codon:yes stop_codon:yes gene_type:complete
MTEQTNTEGLPMPWSEEEKLNFPPQYGCQILLSDTTDAKVNDPTFPTDAYLVYYEENEKPHMDLCRTRKLVSLFDMYYDKFGPNSIKKIEFGYGRKRPNLWGLKPKETKKK